MHPPAIDRDRLAADVTRRRRAQEGDDRADFAWLREAPQRHVRRQFRAHLGFGLATARHRALHDLRDARGLGVTGQHVVDGDAVGAEFPRQRLRPARDRAADGVRHAEVGDGLVHRRRDHVDDAAADGGFPFVQVVVPEEGLGSVALVGRDGVVIAQRTVSAGDPAVSVEVPELDGDRGTLHVRWKASDPDGDALTFAVQFSPDDGVQWQLLDPLVAATELTVPLDGLPGGARCRIRVTASDGIRTALAESAPFELPNRAPRVSITGIRVDQETEYDRYLGVGELMPFAKGVSAKSHEFDAAGNETKSDYRRLIPIVLSYGYHGWIGVEYEGKTSEPEGIKATKKLLETVREELTPA